MSKLTTDDYKRIEAYLKANTIKDSDLGEILDVNSSEDYIAVLHMSNGVLINRKINLANFFINIAKEIIGKDPGNTDNTFKLLSVRIKALEEDNKRLKEMLDTEDKDGNGIKDGQDFLNSITSNINTIKEGIGEEEVAKLINKVFYTN